jgi:hypothetical protein
MGHLERELRGLEFHCRDDCRIIAKAKFAKIFAVKVRGDRFANVGDGLVERFAFRDDGQGHAVGDIFGLAAENARLDGSALHDAYSTALRTVVDPFEN